MLPALLITIGIFGRMLPHEMNFTPVLAVALFSGAYLNKRDAFLLPLSLMLITDIMIGFHETMLLTWGSMALIVGIGIWVKQNQSISRAVAGSLLGAVAFFLITNFGSWIVLYEHSIQGLIQCYTAAVPFFRNTLASTLLFTFVLFGTYEAAKRLLASSKHASLWLAK